MYKRQAKDCVHVAFGMISYEGQSLSTRKGYVVYLEDLLEQAQQKALAIIEEKDVYKRQASGKPFAARGTRACSPSSGRRS